MTGVRSVGSNPTSSLAGIAPASLLTSGQRSREDQRRDVRFVTVGRTRGWCTGARSPSYWMALGYQRPLTGLWTSGQSHLPLKAGHYPPAPGDVYVGSNPASPTDSLTGAVA